jgi:hypothetical protein
MAENRQCGYCRNPGHRRPDCPFFLEQRQHVLTHTPKQRKELIESLGKIGLGIGALVKVDSTWDGEYLGLVKDFDWIRNMNFMDTKNIKYSKQVKLVPLDIKKDYVYRAIHAEVVLMGQGSAQQRNIRVRISNEISKANGVDMSGWAQESFLKIVSPSHDIEYDPDILVSHITMPRRLLKTGEKDYQGHRGIMP